MDKSHYEEKITREKEWYTKPASGKSIIGRILRNPVFTSLTRQAYAYSYTKTQMAETIKRHGIKKVDKLLIAPCGGGDDFKYLNKYAGKIYGIDVSEEAVKACPPEMEAKAGDILKSGYGDNTFDLVASPLFFHHMLKVGFAPFLKEFNRILKPSGKLVILEPSVLYPLNILTRPLKPLFNNPLNEVEDESPFYPGKMNRQLKKCGFINTEMRGASFSHVTFPVSIAKPFNALVSPLRGTYPFKYLAWMVIYWGEKGKE